MARPSEHSSGWNRREFIRFAGLATGSALVNPVSADTRAGQSQSAEIGPYHLVDSIAAPDHALPTGVRSILGWPIFAIPTGSDSAAVVKWTAQALPETEMLLRISVGVDIRENRKVAVFVPGGASLGALDIRYATNLQPFELKISAADIPAIRSNGIGFRVTEGTGPLSIIHPSARIDGIDNHAFLPHLLDPRGLVPLEQFHARMLSRSSLQQFGWTEGCVLQGIWDLQRLFGKERILPALEAHLDSFLDKDGKLKYEDYSNHTLHDSINTIESNLPFAIYALARPDHPVVTAGIGFLLSRVSEFNSTEGCFTEAYPLAVIGSQRKREDLLEHAYQSLWKRKNHLASGPDTIYQNTNSFRNWARGVAWYMLGFSRSIPYLANHPKVGDLIAEFNRCVAFVAKYQRSDGLWNCFLHDGDSGAETSGSAGIAAAMAHARVGGFGDPSGLEMAKRAFQGMLPHLRPDGLLGGASQNNKGGLVLQNASYRVLTPMAMGLMAQLAAYLEPMPVITGAGPGEQRRLWLDGNRLRFAGARSEEFQVELFTMSGKRVSQTRHQAGGGRGDLIVDLGKKGAGPGAYLVKCSNSDESAALRRFLILR